MLANPGSSCPSSITFPQAFFEREKAGMTSIFEMLDQLVDCPCMCSFSSPKWNYFLCYAAPNPSTLDHYLQKITLWLSPLISYTLY